MRARGDHLSKEDALISSSFEQTKPSRCFGKSPPTQFLGSRLTSLSIGVEATHSPISVQVRIQWGPSPGKLYSVSASLSPILKTPPGENAEMPPTVAVHVKPPLAPGGSRSQSPSNVLSSNAYPMGRGGQEVQDLRIVSLPSFFSLAIKGMQLIGVL